MSIGPKLKRQVYDKYNGTCAYCGTAIPFVSDPKAPRPGFNTWFQVDHIIPRSKGGPDTIENLNPSCHRCNWWKTDMTVEEYRRLVVFRRDGVPFFSTAQREWLKRHIIDMNVYEASLAPHVFAFETMPPTP